MSVGGVLKVPWTETNRQHRLEFELASADGNAVLVDTPMGPQPFKILAQFELGRPAGVPAGMSFTAPFSVNFIKPFLTVGMYVMRVLLDGSEIDRLPLRIVETPPIPQ